MKVGFSTGVGGPFRGVWSLSGVIRTRTFPKRDEGFVDHVGVWNKTFVGKVWNGSLPGHYHSVSLISLSDLTSSCPV